MMPVFPSSAFVSILVVWFSSLLLSVPSPPLAFAWTPPFSTSITNPATRTRDTAGAGSGTGGGDGDGNGGNGHDDNFNLISVSVTRRIPHVSPIETHQAWLDYTWRRGGGLPIVVIGKGHGHEHEHEDDDGIDSIIVGDQADNFNERYVGKDIKIPSTRTLLPLFAEETLLDLVKKTTGTTKTKKEVEVQVEEKQQEEFVQQYKLVALGLWKTEIEPNSHLGSVSFAPYNAQLNEEGEELPEGTGTEGTLLTWNVTFTALQRAKFWQTVTQQTISDACDNLASYLSEPILYTMRIPIHVQKKGQVQVQAQIEVQEPSNTTTTTATTTTTTTANSIGTMAEKWFQFVWKNGGGLPIPLPPIPLSQNGYDRMIVPPFLWERVLSIHEYEYEHDTDNDKNKKSEILYTVVNPSILFIHTHLGRVTFQQHQQPSSSSSSQQDDKNNNDNDNNVIDMCWEVCIRPYRNCDAFVTSFIEAVIVTLAVNFKTNVESPDAMVDVYAPRGMWKDNTGPLIQIRRDTWLGNVLRAHLTDGRPVMEQTLDMFQPHKWGTYARDKASFRSSWTKGDISQE